MNRKRPLLVLAILLALSIVTATIIEFISGTASAGAPAPDTAKAPTSTSARNIVVGQRIYLTVGTRVNLRSSPNTNSAIVANMVQSGTEVSLSCYVGGQSVFGDVYWYKASFGTSHGYVSGYWVNTGPDPAATALPRC